LQMQQLVEELCLDVDLEERDAVQRGALGSHSLSPRKACGGPGR
jgi:hypothetical protein